MNAVLRWIESRTGLDTAIGDRLDRPMPGGPGWRYVLPSTLLFTFVMEAITGLVLWMFYSPGSQSAWESVYWVQEAVHGGWALRGLHFYTGQVMLVLVGLYLIQLIFSGLYRAPREFGFWVAVLTLFTLLGLLLTGDLLRWDQEGYWSTQVRTRFLALLPAVGGELFKLAAGGQDFGHLTLTRFFALHAGLLSAILLGLLVWQGWLLRRHGLKAPGDAGPQAAGRYWPRQALRNAVACAVVLAVIGLLVVHGGFLGDHAGKVRGQYLGAPLGAPADPAEAYAAARPEWAFLALYQFANLFPGDAISGSSISWKVVPIFVVPGGLAFLVFLMPFIGCCRVGHAWNVLLTVLLLVALAALSLQCVWHDLANPLQQAALAAGREEARRVKQLARAPEGIPVSGALTLLRSDAKTQGPKLFAQHCASCHNCLSPEGKGIRAEKPSAPNLFGYASRAWIAGLLDPKNIAGPEYFGNTALRSGDMINFVKDTFKDLSDQEKKQIATAVIAVSAEARLNSQREPDARDAERITEGRKLVIDDFGCTDCHRFREKGQLGTAPDLTGYGSREWLIGIICNPAQKRFYAAKNDRMPAYAESPDQPEKNMLSVRSIELLADWVRGQWYEPEK